MEYTRSDRTISCAYRMHARMSSSSSPGYSRKIKGSCHPDARSSRTWSTEILVPRITGFSDSTNRSRIIHETGSWRTIVVKQCYTYVVLGSVEPLIWKTLVSPQFLPRIATGLWGLPKIILGLYAAKPPAWWSLPNGTLRRLVRQNHQYPHNYKEFVVSKYLD